MEIKFLIFLLSCFSVFRVYGQIISASSGGNVLSESGVNLEYLFRNVANSKKINERCALQLEEVLRNFGQEWVLKMIDSTSKVPSGILEGNVADLGNYDECVSIEHNIGVEKIYGRFCALSMTLKIPLAKTTFPAYKNLVLSQNKSSKADKSIPLIFSLCIPNECNPKEFNEFFGTLGLPLSFNDELCHSKADENPVDAYYIFTLTFLILLIFISALSTIYEIYLRKKEKKPAHLILIAFSFYTNGRKLFAIRKAHGQLPVLNGLRFISMMWVIVGHRFSSTESLPLVNRIEVGKWKHEIYSQYVQAAPLAVDTFLFLTGFLMGYIFIKKQMKPEARFNIFLYYIHRYLRLTPAMAALFFFATTWFDRIGDGPFWTKVGSTVRDPCMKWWWSYFLYVQNYVNMNEICLLHTWYLSVDMHMFLISPIILIPLVKYRKPGIFLLILYILISIAIPGAITYIYKTQMFTQDYYDYYYYVSHTRLAPWLIGILLGVFMIQNENRNFKINWLLNLIIWFLILVGMGAIIFTGNDIINNYNRVKSAVYITLHRPLWAAGLCWIVFSSMKGNAGFIGWFLSMPMFQVLGRLTYSMYLLHFCFIVLNLGTLRTPYYASDYTMLYSFCGDLLFTMVLSVFWVLLFESPIITLEKIIFERGTKKSQPEPVEKVSNDVSMDMKSN